MDTKKYYQQAKSFLTESDLIPAIDSLADDSFKRGIINGLLQAEIFMFEIIKKKDSLVTSEFVDLFHEKITQSTSQTNEIQKQTLPRLS